MADDGTRFDEVIREQMNGLLDILRDNCVGVDDKEGHEAISELRHKLSRIVIVSHPNASNLCERSDLLTTAAKRKTSGKWNWQGEAGLMADYGRSGGSAGDLRRIIETMADIERQTKAITGR